MGLYPPGSEVLLSDFRKAVVIARGQDMDNPLVRVTHDPGGMPIARNDQPAVQLETDHELDVAEFLLVGITEEGYGQPEKDVDMLTTGFAEFFQ